MRVLTYNIRFANPADGINAWPRRRDRVASVLRFHALDLVGLQEPLHAQVVDLAHRLPAFAWVGVGRADGQTEGEFTPIFYRRDRFELLDHDTFWLSETPTVAGRKGWDARYIRIATWAQLRDRGSDATFFHFNTHLDNIGATARKESAYLLLAQMNAIAGKQPVVLTGDFNAPPTAPAYRILTGQWWQQNRPHYPPLDDARTLATHAHHGPIATLNSSFTDPLIRRVDYIFVRNVLQRRPPLRIGVRQHGVLTDHWDGRYPSDHLPVLTELTLAQSQNYSQR